MQTGCFYNGGMEMKIFDAHCDVLFQLWSAQGKKDFKNDPQLHITFEQLKKRKEKGVYNVLLYMCQKRCYMKNDLKWYYKW